MKIWKFKNKKIWIYILADSHKTCHTAKRPEINTYCLFTKSWRDTERDGWVWKYLDEIHLASLKRYGGMNETKLYPQCCLRGAPWIALINSLDPRKYFKLLWSSPSESRELGKGCAKKAQRRTHNSGQESRQVTPHFRFWLTSKMFTGRTKSVSLFACEKSRTLIVKFSH